MNITLRRKDGKERLLERQPLFAHCTRRQLAWLASHADLVDVPAGMLLTREGSQPAREFMVLVQGAAEVLQGGGTVNTIGEGDFLGEIALVTSGQRTATVTTTEPALLLVLTTQPFWSLVGSDERIRAQVAAAMAERLGPAVARRHAPAERKAAALAVGRA
jgi:CRP/FNR family cyclic AMP-dependent transcriptional regulator